MVARRVFVLAITYLSFRPARLVGVLFMSKNIDLTHINLNGCIILNIESKPNKKTKNQKKTKKRKEKIKESKVNTYIDPTEMLSPEQLKERSDYNQVQLENFKNTRKSVIEQRVQASVVQNFL